VHARQSRNATARLAESRVIVVTRVPALVFQLVSSWHLLRPVYFAHETEHPSSFWGCAGESAVVQSPPPARWRATTLATGSRSDGPGSI
jgi:hypothetical protein